MTSGEKMPQHPERLSGFSLPLLFISALWAGGVQAHIINLKTYNFIPGLAFKLQCNAESVKHNVSVTWSYNRTQSLENISGISVKYNDLWFLPAELHHRGTVSCLSRKGNETWETMFNIFVQNESCPHMNMEQTAQSTERLTCNLKHIFELDPQAQVTWRKNCSPLNASSGKYLPMNRSSEDDGLYTCFVNFTFEGKKFSAAQTTKIYSFPSDYVVTQPQVIFPKQETYTVTLGDSFDLKCKALIGKNGKEETFMYWLRDTDLVQHYSENFVEENNREYMLSMLRIPEITAQDLHTNFSCVVEHPSGSDFGTAILVPANLNGRYCWIAIGLVSVLILLAAVVLRLFKVDLVLLYRDLCSPAAVPSDGKSYDAYVSYLHGDQLSLSSTTTFALRSLPAVLEDRYGYKLFISGRDELPGEAVHEIVADRMNRSRRLIIILTSQSFTESQKSLVSHSDLTGAADSAPALVWGTYEQRVGLYDALVKGGLKVILVQVEGGVDETLLPESLRYISRTKGVLTWKQSSSDGANRKFWKHLRYHMPPAQKRKGKQGTMLQEVV